MSASSLGARIGSQPSPVALILTAPHVPDARLAVEQTAASMAVMRLIG